jgi:hypothetical protein
MFFTNQVRTVMLLLSAALAGCVAHTSSSGASPPLTLELTRSSEEQISAVYRARELITALYFPKELGGYRTEAWRPVDSAFRWTKEGDGERVERIDGRPFDRVALTIPIDYRALPKSYAPFSPFSDGSTLIHSGQFHACVAAPCEMTEALPITIKATGSVIGVDGRRTADLTRFVSRDDGTNIFVGTLKPVDADGLIAVVDPGLPDDVRRHLNQSLPQAMQFFAAIYGPLSFTPELYVSIDDEREANGGISTQGGTLPNQIFMHFDGENARERVSAENPLWLDWFFAHEAAHLFQQDKSGGPAGDDVAAWLHEGGAEAMAALALTQRGDAERSYAQARTRDAEAACGRGLATVPLDMATAEGNFDLHYQCGLIIWLALDEELRRANRDGLNDLNRTFFAKVRAGKAWSVPVFLKTAIQQGVPGNLLLQITILNEGGYTDRVRAVEELGKLARLSLEPNEST